MEKKQLSKMPIKSGGILEDRKEESNKTKISFLIGIFAISILPSWVKEAFAELKSSTFSGGEIVSEDIETSPTESKSSSAKAILPEKNVKLTKTTKAVRVVKMFFVTLFLIIHTSLN
jgi:hypothetical protein